MVRFVRPSALRNSGFEVSFPTLPTLLPSFTGLRLVQKQYAHDILVLYSHRVRDTEVQTLPTGMPIKLTFGADKTKKDWFGYVSFVSREEGVGVSHTTKIHCVGSSFPLKERANRVFSNLSITEAVTAIAKEFGLTPLVEPHPEKFAQLNMAGHSYWEWLTEQAKRIGYAFRVEGGALWFQSLDSTILSSLPDSPDFSQEFRDSTLVSGMSPNMTYFKVLRGDYVESSHDANTVKQVAGMDLFSGRSVSAKGVNGNGTVSLRDTLVTAPFVEYRSDQVVNSVGSVSSRAEGLRSLARFTVPAEAFVQGDPRIVPFSTIKVSSAGDYQGGYWVVEEVEHKLQASGRYSSEVKLLGDGSGKKSLRGATLAADRRMGIVNINNALQGNNLWNNAGKQNGATLRGTHSTPQNVPSGFSRSSARWTAR